LDTSLRVKALLFDKTSVSENCSTAVSDIAGTGFIEKAQDVLDIGKSTFDV